MRILLKSLKVTFLCIGDGEINKNSQLILCCFVTFPKSRKVLGWRFSEWMSRLLFLCAELTSLTAKEI